MKGYLIYIRNEACIVEREENCLKPRYGKKFFQNNAHAVERDSLILISSNKVQAYI